MIRHARPTDAPTLARLQTYLREPSPGLLDAALDADAYSPATVLVATADDGRPVGYLLAVPGDGTTYVAELVVDPDHRREGIATALLSACAARSERLTVTVAPDDEAARSLYRRCGFEEARRLPDFFADGAAILYRR
ncbi:GNAT family N-acetyltransferase [Haloplanus salinarum]|uniref:GNAT family N-acetyltransferase n=1 Tax=Haloplanus salinarum TaxID=1912324 RepID=UPI00214ADB4D|nr:GNAT family N-acetyltransferase [Haloplanus salinarum]